MIKHVNNDNFESEVLNSEKVVLVDFFATWCGPCQMLAPVLEKIANERTDFDIAKIDIDNSLELATKYNIMVVPSLLIFKNGQVMGQTEGFHSASELLSFVEKYI